MPKFLQWVCAVFLAILRNSSAASIVCDEVNLVGEVEINELIDPYITIPCSLYAGYSYSLLNDN